MASPPIHPVRAAFLEYSWTRYWVLSGHGDHIPEGYPEDSESPLSRFGPSSRPETLANLAGIRCLVLLGEAGSGKSTELKRELARLGRDGTGAGEHLGCDLGSVYEAGPLDSEVFSHDWFRVRTEGRGPMTVFFDSLDEGLLDIRPLGRVLLGKLEALGEEQRQRLTVRLACRSAVWRGHMAFIERQLRLLFGSEGFQVRELCPLRRADQALAARSRGLEPEAFQEAVERAGLHALASWPITLDLLLLSFSKDRALPKGAAELYEEGCVRLCQDSPKRQTRGRIPGAFPPVERMAVAARVAAVSLLSNRMNIRVAQGGVDAADGTLSIEDLQGGSEVLDNERGSFEVGNERIRDLLENTGLFGGAGGDEGAVRWLHRTYAEYLAARYLCGRHLPPDRVIAFLSHPGHPEGKLVPQLFGLSGWAGTLIPEVAERLLSRQPEVLLFGDPARLEPRLRGLLVKALLEACDRGEWVETYRANQRCAPLAYPELADDLRPYCRASEHSLEARLLAVRLAEACRVQELAAELLELALEPCAPIPLRARAAWAVGRLGSSEQIRALRPLFDGDAGEDPEEELKGAALFGLWPEHLSAEALFRTLTRPRSEDFWGWYKRFLLHRLVPGLKKQDLPMALRWLAAQPDEVWLDYVMGQLAADLLNRAWEGADEPEVALALAHALLSEAPDRAAATGFGRIGQQDTPRLRRLVSALVGVLARAYPAGLAPSTECSRLINLSRSLDTEWLLEQCSISDDEAVQRLWCEPILERLFRDDWADSPTVRRILDEGLHNRTLDQALNRVRSIELDTEAAKYLRRSHERQGRLQAEQSEKDQRQRAVLAQVTGLIDDSAAPPDEVWAEAVWFVLTRPDGRGFSLAKPTDLVRRPLWLEADSARKEKLLRAAFEYVNRRHPEAEHWLTTTTIHTWEFMGQAALFFLGEAESGERFLDKLGPDMWARWVPVLFRNLDLGEEKAVRGRLVLRAMQAAPEALVQTLRQLIAHEDRGVPGLLSLRALAWVLAQEAPRAVLAPALLSQAREGGLKTGSVLAILGALMLHGDAAATEAARSWVRAASDPVLAVAGAAALLRHAPEAGWDLLAPWLESRPDLLKEALLVSASGSASGDGGRWPHGRLDEEALAALFRFMVVHVPYDEPGADSGGMPVCVTPEMEAGEFKDALWRELMARGTPRSVQALEQLASDLPQLAWLPQAAKRADEEARARTWVRWGPREVLNMLAHPDHPVIRNETELVEAVLGALEHYQGVLQQQPDPAAISLWNVTQRGNRRVSEPRPEDFFSDQIARHLRDRLNLYGVSVSHEETTRVSTGPGTGNRPDLFIRKWVSQPGGTRLELRVVVEIKGSFNATVREAMETQLVNQYLKDGGLRQGLYLVVWFNPESWNPEDPRRRKNQFATLSEARSFLHEQAQTLRDQNWPVSVFILDASLPAPKESLPVQSV